MKKFCTLLLVALLFVSAAGCGTGEEPNDGDNNEPVEYVDGTYDGEADGYKDIIKVSVEVVNGKIAKVEITEQQETVEIAPPALEQIPVAIVEKNSPDVDTVSGATITSQGIMNAVENALEGATK